MIHSLQFTDPALNESPEARQWLGAVNARLLQAQKSFLAGLTAFGSASLELHALSGAESATDYDDHLLRRKKPQPNPKPRAG
jgi:hypothetical protein